jgi:hypothetical protein
MAEEGAARLIVELDRSRAAQNLGSRSGNVAQP